MSGRYLITGAQGLVGRYLTAHILETERDAQVLGIGRSDELSGFFTHTVCAGGKPRRAPLPAGLVPGDGHRYQRLSLLATADLRRAIEELEPHCIFHLASALHAAPERELFETNIEGTASLMNAVSAGTLLVMGSSGSVYGEAVSLPLSESQPCIPADLYGVTKLAAEQIARVKAMRGGFDFIAARIFNVVGPGQAESHVCARFAAQLSASTSPKAIGVGPLETTRDFIDVRDVAAALLLLARKGERGGTYNVASGRETPIHLVLSELLRISGLTGQVEIIAKTGQPAGVSRHFADISRLRGLGFRPAHSLSQSLQDLFAYHRSL